MAKRIWTCQRVVDGVKCGQANTRIKQKCVRCGGRRPKARAAAHLVALELPYETYVDLNGGDFCGICGVEPKPGRKLHRDHDHRLAVPRGLLCFPCNSALRAYQDADWLRRALAYVERAANNLDRRPLGAADPEVVATGRAVVGLGPSEESSP